MNRSSIHILSCMLVAAVPALVCAQRVELDTVLRHTLRLGSGAEQYASRDDAGSPLQYEAVAVPITLAYEYRGNSYRHLVSASASVGGINAGLLKPNLSSDSRDRRTYFAYADLSYSYMRDWLAIADSTLRLSVGGAIDNLAYVRLYKYFGSDFYSSSGIATYDAAAMGEVVVAGEYALSARATLLGKIAIPIVSVIVRPPYDFYHSEHSVIQWSDAHVVFVGGLVAWDLSLGGEYAIWDGLLLDATYHSRFFRYSRYGWTSAELMQGLNVGLRWRFGL